MMLYGRPSSEDGRERPDVWNLASPGAAWRGGGVVSDSWEPRECQHPRPQEFVAMGGRATCEYWDGDGIHGPAEECEEREGTPCPNPDAHHAFVPPKGGEKA